MRPEPGRVLGGRYALTRRLAAGGMGEVWEADDETLGRPVAVKLLRRELADDPTFLERFRAEARSAASLSHPGVAQVFDFGTDESDGVRTPYMVMELVPGEPLSAVLKREGSLGVARALDVVGQAALALRAAHEAGVVHRDVKPGNLLVMPDGTVKITDFGIARAADAVPLTRTGTVMGTAHYLSPEQAGGKPATPASDVYALGVVAYECLAGVRPFPGDNGLQVALAQVRDPVPPLPEHLPADVRDLVEQALAKDPAGRPPSAGAFGARALALAAAAPGQSTAPSDPGATAVLDVPAAAGHPTARHPTARHGLVPRPDGDRFARMSRPMVALLVAGGLVTGLSLVNAAFTSGETSEASPSGASGGPAATASPPNGSPSPRQGGRDATTSTTVQVDASDYLGERFRTVRAALRRLGLDVVVSAEESRLRPGTVTDISADGEVTRGETVEVTVATRPRGENDEDEGRGHGRGKGDEE